VLESQFYQAYKDQGVGFVAMQLLAEDLQEQTPTVARLAAWVSFYNLTFPVLADPNWQVGSPVGNGYIPWGSPYF
jgi:hypothetical protein